MDKLEILKRVREVMAKVNSIRHADNAAGNHFGFVPDRTDKAIDYLLPAIKDLDSLIASEQQGVDVDAIISEMERLKVDVSRYTQWRKERNHVIDECISIIKRASNRGGEGMKQQPDSYFYDACAGAPWTCYMCDREFPASVGCIFIPINRASESEWGHCEECASKINPQQQTRG